MPNPWAYFATHNIDTIPCVLPQDKLKIQEIQNRLQKSTKKEEIELHWDLFPEPFIGMTDAPIVFLGLNPGFNQTDPDWHKNSVMREAVIANLIEAPRPCPFYPLDPALAGSAIAKWWKLVLDPWLSGNNIRRSRVAERILAIELFPYHSQKFGVRLPEIQKLPSHPYTQALVRDAMNRKALLLILRSQQLWQKAIPELNHYPHVYHLTGSGRQVSLKHPTGHVGQCYDERAAKIFIRAL